jgi:hypothetical protein
MCSGQQTLVIGSKQSAVDCGQWTVGSGLCSVSSNANFFSVVFLFYNCLVLLSNINFFSKMLKKFLFEVFPSKLF